MKTLCSFLLFLTLGSAPSAGAAETAITFDDAELGDPPASLFVIDGEFSVVEVEGGKALQIAAFPLVESGAIGGPSVKGAGKVAATFTAEAKRRSYPRFGVGLHGLSGYRLRVVPAQKQLELSKNESPVKVVPFAWKPGVPTQVELDIVEKDGKWTVSGRAWQGEAPRPEAAQITEEVEGGSGSGKASVWGTPYAGKPVLIDDIVVTVPDA